MKTPAKCTVALDKQSLTLINVVTETVIINANLKDCSLSIVKHSNSKLQLHLKDKLMCGLSLKNNIERDTLVLSFREYLS